MTEFGSVPTESAEQVALARWLDAKRILWCHPPNGGLRNTITARRLRLEGVKAGVPDVLIFQPAPKMPAARGVAIELKRRKGSVISDAQAWWHASLAAAGWHVQVCRGADAAIDALMALGF